MFTKKIRYLTVISLLIPILSYADDLKGNFPDYENDKIKCDKEKENGYKTNFCIIFFNSEEIDKLEKMEKKYFSAAIKQKMDTGEYACTYCKDQIKELNKSENLWHKYIESQCGAVWYNYYGGTAAPVISGDCTIRLYKQHIQDIWYFYLSPPGGYLILPEPKFN
ncbi:TPA: DUF1311 domain-containing protein [Salmonella enterica subsp. enterica serovar Hvittingfoss]|nr:DUF1311 domain-containing protein [Salmonella enterica subsp. enterica serovar Hvittingfoss]